MSRFHLLSNYPVLSYAILKWQLDSIPPKGTRPAQPKPTEGENEGGEREEKDEIRPLYFKVVYVFDVDQTEGKPLPEFEVPSLTGEANEALSDQIMHL